MALIYFKNKNIYHNFMYDNKKPNYYLLILPSWLIFNSLLQISVMRMLVAAMTIPQWAGLEPMTFRF